MAENQFDPHADSAANNAANSQSSTTENTSENPYVQTPETQATGGVNPYGQATTSQAAPHTAAQEQPTQDAQPNTQHYYQGTQSAYGAAPNQPNNQQPYQGQNPYGNQQAYTGQQTYTAQQPIYAEGCVSAALKDIRANDKWLSKTCLLGLINCVPILNFVVSGYALNWSREVPFGGRTSMPSSYITGKNFEIGFYAFLITLVFNLVCGFASAICAFIPLIGFLIPIALSLFTGMFGCLCQMRMAMFQQIGEGFQISRAFNMLKRNWTGLLAAAIIPGLIGGFIVAIVGTIVMLITVGSFVVPASIFAMESATASAVAALGTIGLFGFILLVAYFVLSSAIFAVIEIVTARAVAHWIGRYAPEWTNEVYAASSYGAPRY